MGPERTQHTQPSERWVREWPYPQGAARPLPQIAVVEKLPGTFLERS